MKILIIDNGTPYLGELQELLKHYNCEILPYRGFHDAVQTRSFDLIVLAGGVEVSDEKGWSYYQQEIAFIQETTKPVIGIAVGAELLAKAYNAKLELNKSAPDQVKELTIVQQHAIFANIDIPKVMDYQRWNIVGTGANLEALARSSKSIEVFKHKIKPHFGLQFHPEILVEESDGDEIFLRSIEIALSTK